jgi:hypothetical protein
MESCSTFPSLKFPVESAMARAGDYNIAPSGREDSAPSNLIPCEIAPEEKNASDKGNEITDYVCIEQKREHSF